MKITKISRRFSKKVQIEQYSPIESEMWAEAEVGENETAEEVAEKLYEFCRFEVEKNISEYLDKKNICNSCGGIVRYKDEGKELCEQCKKDAHYQAKKD